MTDLQKRSKTATKEQLRLAELIQAREMVNTGDDVALQKRVKKVVELTNCVPSAAEIALIDCEGSVEEAVALLLDKPDKLVLWSQQPGKTRKSKLATVPTTTSVTNNKQSFGGQSGRRGDSQRGSRIRNEAGGGEQQQGEGGKQGGHNNNHFQGRQKRALSNKDQNGHSDRAKFFENFGGPKNYRNRGGRNANLNEKNESSTMATATTTTNNDNGGNWGKNNGCGDPKNETEAMGTFTSDSIINRKDENKDDEWKSGPRVFMPSSVTSTNNATNLVVNSSSPANAISSWPLLDNNPPSSTVSGDLPQPIQQNKPKTFASVAATKKARPPPLPQPIKVQPSAQSVNEGTSAAKQLSFDNKQDTQIAIPEMTKSGEDDGRVTEWSSVDWGTTTMNPPPAEPSPTATRQPLEQQLVAAAPEMFGSSSHSLNVNQKYTDDLKSVIGLGSNSGSVKSPSNQSASNQAAVPPLNSMDTFQQQISQLTKQSNANTTGMDNAERKKVEFATGDFPPPIADASAYQFGFQFKEVIPSAASLNDAWSNEPHISSVELDRSMLKDATVNVLSTMTNIPTTSSNMTAHAHFSTTTQQQQPAQSHEFQRNTSSRSALSFTDTASVNYPPSNNMGGSGAVPQSQALQQSTGGGIPSTVQQQQQQQQQSQPQQQGKPVYTASSQQQQSQMVVSAQQHLQHQLHQQQQSQQAALYHQQTSASAPTANIPHQFPNYNMPYMYSPAPGLPGQNAELDRFFMQQQYAPYTGLDVQLGAMSLGPPTTLAPSHRNPMDSFMDNKFGPNQQQQSVNQGNTAALQHNQSNQQHRGPAQNETNALFGGSGQVAPPPGFGIPNAGAQPSFMPQAANLQSLFQMPTMPTYHHPQMSYHQQFMMPNAANRMASSQRPAQTSPPEGNGGHQQRRHDNRGGPVDSQGGYGGGNGAGDSVDHSSGGGGGGQSAAAQSYMNKFNYRQYM